MILRVLFSSWIIPAPASAAHPPAFALWEGQRKPVVDADVAAEAERHQIQKSVTTAMLAGPNVMALHFVETNNAPAHFATLVSAKPN